MCARAEGFDWFRLVQHRRQPLLIPLPNWRHGPLRIPKGSTRRWCSDATPGSRSALGDPAPCSRAGRPRGQLFAAVCVLGRPNGYPLQTRRRFIPHSLDHNCLDHTSHDLPNPNASCRPAQERPGFFSVVDVARSRLNQQRIDPGSRNISPLPAGRTSPPRGTTLVFGCQGAATAARRTGRAVAAGTP